MEKLNINKLIANDIVKFGIDNTNGIDYSVFLNSYLEDFDDESKEYILKNKKEIIEAVRNNEILSHFDYDEDKEMFDLMFYYDGLLDDVEMRVYEISDHIGKNIELDDIRDIASNFLSSKDFYDNISSKIAKCKGDWEL